jgi:hypothetical protein
LPLAEVAHELDEHRDVALLLADERRRRVLASAGEPGTVGRAFDFDQSLRAAADRADLLAEGGTSAPGAPISARWADHRGHYCIIRPKTAGNSSERALQPIGTVSSGAAFYE